MRLAPCWIATHMPDARTVEPNSNPVWLFGGVCVLCSRSVQILLRHESGHELRFVPIQSDEDKVLAQKHGIDPVNPASFIYLGDGEAFQASDAVLKMLDYTRWTLLWMKIAKLLPKSLRDFAYYALARNRYKLFGKYETCIIPTVKQLQRVLLPSKQSAHP
jgi:predicted DCC family thiol-disulfide oxidoreductase YuxK